MATQPKKNRKLFDDFAERYDRNDEITGGWITQWVEGVLADKGGGSAVDLGCGSGRVANIVARHYEKVRAVDLSPEMIALAQRKRPHPRIDFEVADLMAVDGQYDLVISMMTLHHVPDIEKALAHIASLVKPGGTAILVDNAVPNATTRLRQRVWAARVLAQEIVQAFRKFRFANDNRWLDHVMSDRYLTPQDFVAEYGKAFPGSAIAPVGHLHASVWKRQATSPEEPV